MFQHWRYDDSDNRYTGTKTVEQSLPSGLYQLFHSNHGEPMAIKAQLNDEDLYTFSSGNNRNILDEVTSFWDNRDRYKKLGVTHKRGILLHGAPGCGKTAIISLCMKDMLRRDGICLILTPDLVGHLKEALPKLQQVEKERDVLIIMEDLESFRRYEHALLEIMDGTSSLGNGILYLATTNYLDQIPIRFSHRPSRFDTLLEVGLPSLEERMEYLSFVSQKMFGTNQEEKTHQWAKLTEGFSIAQLKELVISVVIHRHTLKDSLERLSILCPEVVAESEDGTSAQELRQAYTTKYDVHQLWEEIDEDASMYEE